MDLKELKLKADEYARFSFVGLGIPKPKNLNELWDIFARYRFHFVFPNLTENEMCELMALFILGQVLQMRCKMLGNERSFLTAGERARIDSRASENEQDFMVSKDCIREALWPKLTTIQKDFITEELFTIRLSS